MAQIEEGQLTAYAGIGQPLNLPQNPYMGDSPPVPYIPSPIPSPTAPWITPSSPQTNLIIKSETPFSTWKEIATLREALGDIYEIVMFGSDNVSKKVGDKIRETFDKLGVKHG